MGWWETIYLGKAGKQKTSSLQTRLYDELREESVGFWAMIYGDDDAKKQFKSIYKGKYNPERGMRKAESRFVIWIAHPEDISEDYIARQEENLIKIYRPTHNVKRSGVASHDVLSEEIERKFEEELNKLRK